MPHKVFPELPLWTKRSIVVVTDLLLVLFSVELAFFLRLGVYDWSGVRWRDLETAFVAAAIALPILWLFGCYRQVFRYFEWDSVRRIFYATLLFGAIFGTLVMVAHYPGVPRTVGLIHPPLLLIAIVASRIGASRLMRGVPPERGSRLPVIIYGAGDAGRQLDLAISTSREMEVVALVDDDSRLHGRLINGKRVLPPAALPQAIERHKVVKVMLALPSASHRRRREILDDLVGLEVDVQTLPGIADLASGRVSINDLRKIDILDLLGRDIAEPDPELMERHIRGKVVLVTGAGGSIGSELCRQILALRPASVVMVEHSEFALYQIEQELAALRSLHGYQAELFPLLASVCDQRRMADIFAGFRPDTIYHAAAYKHVPLVEQNCIEGVRNNAIGTAVMGRLARQHGVGRFILISTDKAVRPTNIMGASKRLAELFLQAFAAEGGKTCFTMVRFGNVLGSSGSVVPLFQRQIAQGGPVTVTDVNVTRYFMTISEAVQLVIQTGTMASSGELFLLDMGEPVRIYDLARRMIELSGRQVRDAANPDGDIEIAEVGLRPGEKLYEELLIGESHQATHHPRIMKANEPFLDWRTVEGVIAALEDAIARGDTLGVSRLVKTTVPEYTPSADISDILHSIGTQAISGAMMPELECYVATENALPAAAVG